MCFADDRHCKEYQFVCFGFRELSCLLQREGGLVAGGTVVYGQWCLGDGGLYFGAFGLFVNEII